MVPRVIIALAFCTVAVASPIIRIKTVNGQKKSYCCYGVVRPFDMEAKAKQGLRALTQVGFNLRKLRIALDFHQKAVEGKLENVEKEAEDLNKRVREALQATMKILSDATKKASKTLREVTAATNDLGKLGKDIQGTKTFDMITKIRALIAEKPADKKSNETKDNDKKPGDKNTDDKKPKDAKSDDRKKEDTKSDEKKSKDMKADSDKTAKATKPKETKKEDQAKSKKKHKGLRPKDRIPGTNRTDKSVEAQRLLVNAEMYENEQVKRARNAIEKKKEENKRAFEKAKDFLRQIQDGLLQFQHGIANEAGFELN